MIGLLQRWMGKSASRATDAVRSQAGSAPPTEQTSIAKVFTEIYQTNAWLDPESRSGPGSTLARSKIVRANLLLLLEKLGIKSLLDAPCGDFNWMKEVPMPGIRYTGVDVVQEMIAENHARYAGHQREFLCLDITGDPLPKVDTIFCRDGLVHLSNAEVFLALSNFKRSGSKFLVTTTFPAQPSNTDIPTGSWRPLNLEKAPFLLPPPRHSVSDGCPHPGYTDKLLAVWRLKDLPLPG